MRYRRKPFVIDVYQIPFDGPMKSPPDWVRALVENKWLVRDGEFVSLYPNGPPLPGEEAYSVVTVKRGDWLGKTQEDRVFAIPDGIFQNMYEPEMIHV